MMTIASAISLAGLLLLLPCLPAPALAAGSDDENRLYQIELIIFENKAATESTEILPGDPGQVDLENTVELSPLPSDTIKSDQVDLSQPPPLPSSQVNGNSETNTPGGYQTFELLPDELLELSDSLKRLDASGDYQPLIHIGWRQPVPELNNAQPVLIDSRKLLLNTARIEDNVDAASQMSGEPVNKRGTDTPPDSLYDQGPDEIITRINENFVAGTLTLTRGHYLHLKLDLLYQRQSNAPQLFSFFGFSNTGNTSEKYRLTESRRMKRGEIHYFDHPKFGVIAVVTAVADEDTDQVQTIPLNR